MVFRALILFLGLAATAEARLPRQTPFESVRALGMGNAFMAIADDANALFYNPAALARVKGFHLNLIDLTHGSDSLDSSRRLKDAVFQGDFKNMIRTDTEYLRLGVKPVFSGPYFALSVFDDVRSFFDLRNLAIETALDAQIDMYTVNDLGAALGIGIPAGEHLSIGATVKLIQRTEIDVFYTAQDLYNVLLTNRENFLGAIYEQSRSLAGVGYAIGANLGMLFKVPLVWKSPEAYIAATIEDVGATQFRGFSDNVPRPKTILPSYHLGGALKYKLTKDSAVNLAADLRNNFRPLPFLQQLHVGAEYDHRFFALRVGAYHAYWTAGATIKLAPHTRIHAATYAMELEGNLWQRSQRWYILQVIVGFNPL